MSPLRSLGLLSLLLCLSLSFPTSVGAAPPKNEPDEPHAPLPAAAARSGSSVAPAPAARPAKARVPRLFRFDALRIEGLAGPNALVLRTLDHGRRRSLLRYRRSFLRRILTTLEAPTR